MVGIAAHIKPAAAATLTPETPGAAVPAAPETPGAAVPAAPATAAYDENIKPSTPHRMSAGLAAGVAGTAALAELAVVRSWDQKGLLHCFDESNLP